MLVFDNDVRGKRDPDGVHIVGREFLIDYLTDMPTELERDELKRIGRALLDDETWSL